MPGLAAEEAVRPTTHLLAAVKGALVLDAVEKVTHDGRVIRPAFRGRSDLVVAMEETDPVAVGIAPGRADQLRAEAGDDEAKAVLFVGEDVEEAVAALFFDTRELHCSGIGGHRPPLQVMGTSRGSVSLS